MKLCICRASAAKRAVLVKLKDYSPVESQDTATIHRMPASDQLSKICRAIAEQGLYAWLRLQTQSGQPQTWEKIADALLALPLGTPWVKEGEAAEENVKPQLWPIVEKLAEKIPTLGRPVTETTEVIHRMDSLIPPEDGAREGLIKQAFGAYFSLRPEEARVMLDEARKGNMLALQYPYYPLKAVNNADVTAEFLSSPYKEARVAAA